MAAAGGPPAGAAVAPVAAPGAAPADPRAAALALIGGLPDAGADRLAALAAEKRRIADEKKRNAAEMKKEQQKRQRLMVKAKGLSDADLINVIANRGRAKAKAKGKAN